MKNDKKMTKSHDQKELERIQKINERWLKRASVRKPITHENASKFHSSSAYGIKDKCTIK